MHCKCTRSHGSFILKIKTYISKIVHFTIQSLVENDVSHSKSTKFHIVVFPLVLHASRQYGAKPFMAKNEYVSAGLANPC